MINHVSVLLQEAVDGLEVIPDHWYIDATFGQGGHTKKMISMGAKVVGFDWDPEAVLQGELNFSQEIKDKKLVLIQKSFAEIQSSIELLRSTGQVDAISGILFDFGTSTQQLTSQDRGFSFEGDGPLDMRMNPELGVTAADLLAAVPEAQLEELFREYGGEIHAKGVARAVKKSPVPITTTSQLRQIIERIYGNRHTKIHPATKVFQALRIAVNSELDQIEKALPQAFDLLELKGNLVTIAFHEGEDRIAKKFMKLLAINGVAELKPRLIPSEKQIEENSRARSAKLRVAKKIKNIETEKN
jgi:16S rRNA (cytosine1402-N4)-methyltransferase